MGNKPQKGRREASKSEGESKSELKEEKANEEVIDATKPPNSTDEVSHEVLANCETKTTEEVLVEEKDVAQKIETVEVKVVESKPCDAKETEASTKKDLETAIHVDSVAVEQKPNPTEEMETKESSIKVDDILQVTEEKCIPAHPVITDGDKEKENKHTEEVKEEESPVKCNNITSVADHRPESDVQINNTEVEDKAHIEPAVIEKEEVSSHENSPHTVEPENGNVQNN